MISTCSSVATALVVVVVIDEDGLASCWCRPEGWRWRKGG
jgi:hypothetical protein